MSARAAFRSHLAECMRQLGYESNKADPNLWMKECTQEIINGPKKYYLYILIYVDDLPCINDDLWASLLIVTMQEKSTCSSFLKFLHTNLNSWYSKRQSMIETYTFGTGIFCHEDSCRNPMWNMVKITYDGYSHRWSYTYLWS